MQQAFERTPLRATTTELTYQLFHRVIAFYCLLFGMLYWVRLIGYYDGPNWRFDLMPAHWQVASVTLAVLFPFAASGLWMMASWGPVIWFICAAIEAVMYVGFPDLFGHRYQLVISHVLVALLYATFRVVMLLQKRGQAEK
ncbi:DUF6163 family protein [Aquamicrobium sp. LC103]|uniref:DUF6163 family protein n=1 Tax=Aquamicrobium sp. LC103 TaxID=1120658 RepID=UPI00063E8FA4|nr:DUF6163 family protein [Aquamicrobium sp. LC103]TKT81416.1 hypothetical protein XW59_006025 [Aquamicrobium sp. LC103]